MNILLTFTGFHDPYSLGLVEHEEQEGPILSLVRVKIFDKIILFSTPNTVKNTDDTVNALKLLYSNLEIEVRDLSINDPTDYLIILKGLRDHFREISSGTTNAEYYISVASGTPQMHACWLLLVASGEIPAHILHIRPHRFVNKDNPIISEINFTSSEFPIIRSNICRIDVPEIPTKDISIVISQLGIVGDHPAMNQILEEGAILASSNVPVLILGETGTGKELLAKYIHYLSDRASNPFIPINCGAIPEGLVESFLFGHKKGSFTGAIRDQIGKFDQANGGTLFLDEIAELPLTMQTKLLRILQDGIVEPLGENKSHRVDVRIIAATNQNIKETIGKGEFREDLYYRLNVGEITLLPLRNRKTDIPKISLNILDRFNLSLRRPKSLAVGALNRLQNHSWPGNVRELENVIERSVLRARNQVLEAEDILLSEPLANKDNAKYLPEPHEGFSLNDYIDAVREQLISKALDLSNGNQSGAAKLLGISPQAVHKFVHQGNMTSKP